MSTAYHAIHDAEWDETCSDCHVEADPLVALPPADPRLLSGYSEATRHASLDILLLCLAIGVLMGIAYATGAGR